MKRGQSGFQLISFDSITCDWARKPLSGWVAGWLLGGGWVAGWLGGWVSGWLGGWVAGWLGGWVAGWLGGWVAVLSGRVAARWYTIRLASSSLTCRILVCKVR